MLPCMTSARFLHNSYYSDSSSLLSPSLPTPLHPSLLSQHQQAPPGGFAKCLALVQCLMHKQEFLPFAQLYGVVPAIMFWCDTAGTLCTAGPL